MEIFNRVNFKNSQKDYALFLPAISEMYSKYIVSKNPKREPPHPVLRSDLNYLDKKNRLFYLPSSLYSAGQAAKTDSSARGTNDIMAFRDRSETIIVGDSGGFQVETGVIKWQEEAIYEYKNGEDVIKYGPIMLADGITPKLDNNGNQCIGVQTENNKTVHRMLRWLERVADWSMVLDFPTGSITRGRHNKIGFPIYVVDKKGKQISIDSGGEFKKKTKPLIQYEKPINPDFCLRQTLRNNDYFMANRVPGDTKFLNVIQGRSHSEIDWWYDNVKKYSAPSRFGTTRWINNLKEMSGSTKLIDLDERAFEGWALAGAHKEDFGALLRRIIIMRDDQLLDNKDWIHILGMGKLKNGCVFTTIQRELRRTVNQNITLSYDVSSPFSTAAYGNVITQFDLNKNAWSMQQEKLDGQQYLGSNESLHSTPGKRDSSGNFIERGEQKPISSPLADMLTMGDVCVNAVGGEDGYTSSWDICSYAMMMHHNVFMYYDAYLKAQAAYDEKDILTLHKNVPSSLLLIRDIVYEVFKSETPIDVITSNLRELRKISINRNGILAVNSAENVQDFGNFVDVAASYKIAKDRYNSELEKTKILPNQNSFGDIFS